MSENKPYYIPGRSDEDKPKRTPGRGMEKPRSSRRHVAPPRWFRDPDPVPITPAEEWDSDGIPHLCPEICRKSKKKRNHKVNRAPKYRPAGKLSEAYRERVRRESPFYREKEKITL